MENNQEITRSSLNNNLLYLTTTNIPHTIKKFKGTLLQETFTKYELHNI